MVFVTYQNSKRTGRPFKQAIPTGYGLGLIGVMVFLLGGICDMTWHIILGVEEDLAALLSPSHLLLLAGVLLIITSPLRMGWAELGAAPRWKEFFPAFLSMTLTISITGFFLMYAWTFNNGWVATTATADQFLGDHMYENIIKLGVINTIISTTLLMAPLYFLLKRWKLPFGTVTLMFLIEITLMSALQGFDHYPVILVGIISGLAADLWLNRRSGTNLRVFSIVIPVLLWGLFYAGVALSDGMGWEPEIWGGAVVLSSLWSLGLQLLVFPPAQAGGNIEKAL